MPTMTEMPGMWILEQRIGGLCPCVPKSEYVLCEPPEVWVDVTGECVFMEKEEQIWHQLSRSSIVVLGHGSTNLYENYRFRKIIVYAGNTDHPKSAFIVERKQ